MFVVEPICMSAVYEDEDVARNMFMYDHRRLLS